MSSLFLNFRPFIKIEYLPCGSDFGIPVEEPSPVHEGCPKSVQPWYWSSGCWHSQHLFEKEQQTLYVQSGFFDGLFAFANYYMSNRSSILFSFFLLHSVSCRTTEAILVLPHNLFITGICDGKILSTPWKASQKEVTSRIVDFSTGYLLDIRSTVVHSMSQWKLEQQTQWLLTRHAMDAQLLTGNSKFMHRGVENSMRKCYVNVYI